MERAALSGKNTCPAESGKARIEEAPGLENGGIQVAGLRNLRM